MPILAMSTASGLDEGATPMDPSIASTDRGTPSFWQACNSTKHSQARDMH